MANCTKEIFQVSLCAMEIRLMKRGSLCWTRFTLSEAYRNVLHNETCNIFCAICHSKLRGRPFDTRIIKIKNGLVFIDFLLRSGHLTGVFTLYGWCQKVCFIVFIGKLRKRTIPGFSLCNGDKTHESWKPLLNTIHVFRGLSECFAQWNLQYFFVKSDIINLNADLLTPESI